jgi:hypothetical protein
MVLDKKIEQLIEKYFQGETSIAEENELKNYFSSSNVAQHLEQYKPIFGYFSQAKTEQFDKMIPLKTKKQNKAMWFSFAASVVVLLGIGTFMYFNNETPKTSGEYGTYENPEVALKETQKALALLSKNVNIGIESVGYINEYEVAKDKVFVE